MAAIDAALETTDVNEPDPMFGVRPLSRAALVGHADAVRRLIKRGADVNLRNRDQGTPLHAAAFFGRAEVVEVLVNAGADINLVNNAGVTPLQTLQADWEFTQGFAKMLQMELDRDELMQGRERIAEILNTAGNSDGAPTQNTQQRSWKKTVKLLVEWPLLGHLWFLAHLTWLVIAFLLFAWIGGLLGYRGIPNWLWGWPIRYVWLVPLALLPQIWMTPVGFGPDTSPGVLPKPAVLCFYGVFFFVGALYWESQDHEARIGRWWWVELPLALAVLFPLGLNLAQQEFGFGRDWFPESTHEGLACTLQVGYAWMMTFALIGITHRVFNHESTRIRFISDSSYWLYLVHLPLVIYGQVFVRNWSVSPFLKFVLLNVVISAVLLISYRYLVRYTWLGRLLNGPRARPASSG